MKYCNSDNQIIAFVAAVIGGATSATFTRKDFSYNFISNQPLVAGDTGTGPTGIIETIVSSINLFPNPATNHLTISLRSNNKNVEVTIVDITGKIIYSTTASETQQIEVNTKDFIETKKFVVEK